MICDHCGRDVQPTKEGSCSYCSAPLHNKQTKTPQETTIMELYDEALSNEIINRSLKYQESFWKSENGILWIIIGAAIIAFPAILVYPGEFIKLFNTLRDFLSGLTGGI